ncbi:MAG: methylated-DNA--[protein]-cysteine S-methyltransferase [Ilumatobacteraceae bacterium]|nr:methylated-DNA--[protein]-cysteine S-methyltransferase [Ilumatobacteraceae bacterium]
MVTVVGSDLGIRYVMFSNDAHRKPLERLHISDTDIHDSVHDAVTQLQEYFRGVRCEFELPLDLQGTEFQIDAWSALAKVPYGLTASYGQQAASIGRPRAVRAIGGANGRNPVAIVLPCHRIVGADGSLTGFGGGIAVKKWLLDHEQSMLHSATGNCA